MSDSLYEEQLSAAKFRAERDQARQECERLRARLRDSVPREAYERKRAAWLRQIRECETALHKRREYIKKLENAALERRTVREEDHEAAEWVREHGGLDNVKKLLDWVVGHCSTKQQLDFDFWLSGRVMHELGFEEDMADRDEVDRRLLSRLMPEGYEWPRYETGELLRYDDRYIQDGAESEVWHVDFDSFGDVTILNKDGSKCSLDKGERVKRTEPKVLDSEGVECNVGDAVWWVHNKTGNFRIIRIEQDGKCAIHDDDADEPCGMTVPSTELTHKRPVLDADGVEIRVGDEVYHVEYGTEYEVCEAKLPMVTVEYWCAGISAHGSIAPSLLTHRAPVLAADGKPLREGETVLGVDSGTRYTVEKITDELIPIKCCSDMGSTASLYPSQLTHERPDSWERLEEDARKPPFDYWVCSGIGCDDCPAKVDGERPSERFCTDSCGYAQQMDLVRRARALAERGQS